MALALTQGQLFAGDYRIERLLGEGGMGSVYVVTQVSTSAPRALKLMRVELAIDPSLRRRFEQEARIGAGIASDHVVRVLAAGVDEETRTPWLAMELLEGETLGELAAARGPLEPALVAELFLQLCHALAAAHALGVVHRDLKPENVFVARAQRPGAPFTVKVLDFGIAKMIAESSTKSTEPIGTPLWMSPEQTQHDQPVTPASDVWALGLIAFFLLTGKLYWRGGEHGTSPMMLLRQIALDALPAASARAAELGVASRLPAGFDAWFARAVARDPGARFAEAGAAQAALAVVLGGAALPAGITPPSPAPSAPPGRRGATPFELDETAVPSRTAASLHSGARPPRRAAGLAVAAVLVASGVGIGVRAALRRSPVGALSAPVAEAVPASVTATASGPASATVPAVPPPDSASAAAPPEAASVGPLARAIVPPRAVSAAPSASAKPAELPPFNAVAARMALDNMKILVSDACGRLGAGPAAVSGSVSFDTSGKVIRVDAQAPDLALQACVRGRMLGARVAPFSGPEQAMGFSYLVKHR